MITRAEAEALFGAAETPEPLLLDRKKLLGIGLAAFAVVLLILLLARRKRKH